jgi:hypothetical protein
MQAPQIPAVGIIGQVQLPVAQEMGTSSILSEMMPLYIAARADTSMLNWSSDFSQHATENLKR